MKTAIKVLIIIGMVCGFWMILPLIFGFMQLKKINNGEKLTTTDKVLMLLFVNTLGGILAFCTDEV